MLIITRLIAFYWSIVVGSIQKYYFIIKYKYNPPNTRWVFNNLFVREFDFDIWRRYMVDIIKSSLIYLSVALINEHFLGVIIYLESRSIL